MAKIIDGRLYDGLTKGINSVTDRNYYSVDAGTGTDDYETSYNYMLMSGNDNDAWRDYYDESEYGIDPYDYETEDEYLEAIEDIY